MLRHICMQAGKGGVVPLQLASAVIHTQVIPRGYRALMLGLNGVTLHKDHGDGGNIIVAGLQQVPVRVDADTVAGQDGGHLVQVALQPGEGKGVLPGAPAGSPKVIIYRWGKARQKTLSTGGGGVISLRKWSLRRRISLRSCCLRISSSSSSN